MVKIVCISDTHNKHEQITIPPCDILISTGDYSMMGKLKEVRQFHSWMNKQPAQYKISVQGNHEVETERDWGISKQNAQEVCPDVYFIDEGLVEIEGLKIWCSAITPFFMNWAWNRQRGYEIRKHWDRIPQDVDIIATHGPPFGCGDFVLGAGPVGCRDLLYKILKVKPLVSCSGHIHGGRGIRKNKDTLFINASICNEQYEAVNKPIEIEIDIKNKKVVSYA